MRMRKKQNILAPEVEMALIVKMQLHRAEARHQLILSNIGLPFSPPTEICPSLPRGVLHAVRLWHQELLQRSWATGVLSTARHLAAAFGLLVTRSAQPGCWLQQRAEPPGHLHCVRAGLGVLGGTVQVQLHHLLCKGKGATWPLLRRRPDTKEGAMPCCCKSSTSCYDERLRHAGTTSRWEGPQHCQPP